MRERKEILTDLVQNKKDFTTLIKELSYYPWDSDEPLYIVNSEDIYRMLELYIHNAIDAEILENWANAIESREDLNFESDEIQEVINKIANPTLFGTISNVKVENYLKKLKSQKQ